MKVVLGRKVLSEVASDMEKMVLPRWVDPAPKRAGQKKQGKLSADQWRSLCSIHLVITLIRLWGHLPAGERWHQMLVNFLDLVLAVELGSMMVTSADHAAAYETVLTRYLVVMKELYKEAVVVPTHHLALHVPDFLRLWGPSPQARGFGWERFNHMLQGINTNKRFGLPFFLHCMFCALIESPGLIERSYMYTASRASNLLALLAVGGLKTLVSNMYAKLNKIINRDSRGTRLHDLILDSLDTEQPPPTTTVAPITLEVPVLEALAAYLNTSATITYIPVHRFEARSAPHARCLLHDSAQSLPSLKQAGTTYRPYHRSDGDCNVMVRPAMGDAFPARLELIFMHERLVGSDVSKDIFCAIRRLKPLEIALQQQDYFRKFEIGGSLWSPEYADELQVVRPQALMCHFARTEFSAADTQVGLPTLHVLPLDRVSSSATIFFQRG